MRQGEIWLVNLDPTVGSEIRKTRSATIVNDDRLGKLPLKTIVPLTDWKPAYAQATWMVRVLPDSENKLLKESAADAFQVRSVAQERLVRQLGRLGPTPLQQVQRALAAVLSILPIIYKLCTPSAPTSSALYRSPTRSGPRWPGPCARFTCPGTRTLWKPASGAPS